MIGALLIAALGAVVVGAVDPASKMDQATAAAKRVVEGLNRVCPGRRVEDKPKPVVPVLDLDAKPILEIVSRKTPRDRVCMSISSKF